MKYLDHKCQVKSVLSACMANVALGRGFDGDEKWDGKGMGWGSVGKKRREMGIECGVHVAVSLELVHVVFVKLNDLMQLQQSMHSAIFSH